MKKQKINTTLFSIILPIGVIIALSFIYKGVASDVFMMGSTTADGDATHYELKKDEKHRGTHLFGRLDTSYFDELLETNVEGIALVPWAFQKGVHSSEVSHNSHNRAYVERYDSSWVSRIKTLRDSGFKVFLKPHLWLHETEDGEWRSDITHLSETEWDSWKDCYRDFILRYARVAERGKAELFCIGTEFTNLTSERPQYWRDLIKDVRSVYSGKVTYGANWYKEYKQIKFWDDLDYIGVQAYFPVTNKKYPEVKDVASGWKKHVSELNKIQKKYKKKILFTEMGYKSIPQSGIRPWEWVEDINNEEIEYSAETQANCYKAFFDEVWDKPWFGGLYIWQMRSDFSF